jgi:predicted nucleotidyltransferase
MSSKEDILSTLRTLLPEMAARYKLKEIGLFGSCASRQEDEASDIDVLVDFGQDASLLDLVGLALFLEERLGRKVDVVPKESLRAEIRESVLREAVTL